MPLISENEPGDMVATLVRRRLPPPGTASHRVSWGVPADRPLVPLEEVLSGRRSVRLFAGRPLARADLLQILGLAEDSQLRQWPVAEHGDADLRILVVAYHVEGLREGLYLWSPHDGTLEPLGTGPWLAGLRHQYAPAPTLILVAGSAHHGEAGAYGGLLVRTGALGYAIWLAARSFGLDCSIFGRSNHQVSMTSHDREPGTRHLLTVAVGYTAEPAAEGTDSE